MSAQGSMWDRLAEALPNTGWWSEYAEPIEEVREVGVHVRASDITPYASLSQDDARVWTFFVWGDYVGSDVDRANYTEIVSELGDVFLPYSDIMGAQGWALVEGARFGVANTDEPLTDADQEQLMDRLCHTVWSLVSDYPLLSDDAHGEVVQALADEAWDAWLRSDIRDDLAKAVEALGGEWDGEWESVPRPMISTGIGDPTPDPRDGDDIVRDVYYTYDGNEWVCESATSAVNQRHDDAVEHVARELFILPRLR